MIFRVILKIGYYENWFDFDNLEDAGIFAEAALSHCVPNEDRKTAPTFVAINMIDKEKNGKRGG